MEKLELIVDENTSLFLYQEEDAQELFELVDSNRNYFKQWLPWLSYNTKVEDTHQFILEGNANYKKRVSLNLGIKYQDKIVGSVSFNTINLIHKNDCIGIILNLLKNNIWNVYLNAVFPKHSTKKNYYTNYCKHHNLPLPIFNTSEISKGKIIDSYKLAQLLNYTFKETP